MWLLIVGAVILALAALVIFNWIQMITWNQTKTPGTPFPLIGHSYQFMVPQEDIWKTAEAIILRSDEHERKMTWFLGPKPRLLLYHPEPLKEFFTNTTTLLNKSKDYDPLEKWLGSGLLISRDEKWHHRRKMLTPAFHFKILDDALITFNEQADVMVDVLHEDFVEKYPNGLDVFPYVQRATLDIILETAMGVSLGVQGQRESEYLDCIEEAVQIIQQRQFIPWYMNDTIFSFFPIAKRFKKVLQRLLDFTKEVIRDKAENFHQKLDEKNRVAFLDLLLSYRMEDPSSLTLDNIQEEVDTFMFEGHDTTTCSIAWTLFLIGNHAEVQERLWQEQLEIFGPNGTRTNVSKNDMSKMKYLEACLKESLRLYPSVPIFGRKAGKDMVVDGVKVKKGMSVLCFTSQLHRNTKIWESPNKFIPERFLNHDEPMDPYAYVPFSAGPRNCIGQKFAQMEEKTVMSKIIRSFEIVSLDREDQVKAYIAIITRPHNGINIKLKPRVA